MRNQTACDSVRVTWILVGGACRKLGKGPLELESGQAAHRADFAVYELAVLGPGATLLIGAPDPAWPLMVAVLTG